MVTRSVVALLAAIALAGCEYYSIDRNTLVGAYQANWESDTRLILNDDGTYFMEGGLPASGIGEWDFTRFVGDASVTLRAISDEGIEQYDVRWNRSLSLEIVVDVRRGHVFTKVAD